MTPKQQTWMNTINAIIDRLNELKRSPEPYDFSMLFDIWEQLRCYNADFYSNGNKHVYDVVFTTGGGLTFMKATFDEVIEGIRERGRESEVVSITLRERGR